MVGSENCPAITDILVYGVELLKGLLFTNYCEGTYIVVIASMSMISTPDSAALPDYVQPASASVDPGMHQVFFVVIHSWISMSGTPGHPISCMFSWFFGSCVKCITTTHAQGMMGTRVK